MSPSVLAKALSTLAVLFVALPGAAQTCKAPQLRDFAAYALETMDLKSSDYQGLAGAGVGIKAERFLFEGNRANCLAVATAGNFDLFSGSTLLPVESGAAFLRNARVTGELVSLGKAELSASTVAGFVRSPVRPRLSNSSSQGHRSQAVLRTSHQLVAAQLFEASARMAALPVSATVETSGGAIVVQGPGAVVVANLQAEAVGQIRRVVLRGTAEQNFVLNLWGDRAVLVGLQVILEGGVTPSRVSWNLPNADFLFISNTHDGVLGIPGAIYAPLATTEFYDGLVTGALYVRRIVFDSSRGFRNSGQINRAQIILPPGTQPFN